LRPFFIESFRLFLFGFNFIYFFVEVVLLQTPASTRGVTVGLQVGTSSLDVGQGQEDDVYHDLP